MLHKGVNLSIGGTAVSKRIRLRPPQKGGVMRIAHLTLSFDLMSGANGGFFVAQVTENQQQAIVPLSSAGRMLQNESALATWAWFATLSTSGGGVQSLTKQLMLGVEVAADLVLQGQATTTTEALLDVYYEEVEVSSTEKLWLVRQQPRRFPGNPQTP